MMRSTWFSVIGTALIVCSVGCSGSSSNPSEAHARLELQAVEVEVASVERRQFSSEVEFTGNLLPRRVTRITPEVDGVVREIPQIGTTFDVVMNGKHYSERVGIMFGQAVSQGDVLVQLDAEDFEISVLMAQAKLSKARADLAKVMSWQRAEEIQRVAAMRDEAKARYDQSNREHQRLQQLHRQNIISASQFEQAAMEVSTSRALLESTEATLASAKAGPTAEEIAVQKAMVAQAEVEVRQAQRNVAKATLKAPYDGIVTSINVELGDRVSPSSGAVIEVMDLRYVVAEIGVPESYIGGFKVSDMATVRAAGVEQAVPGLVIAINEMVDPQTRTFKVRIAIDNEQRQFKAGQFATVQLPLTAAQGKTLTVPNRSIVFVEGQPNVFVVEGDHVRQRPVKVGLGNHSATELLSGVIEGDVVVTDDPSLLADGMKVSIRQQPANVASL